MMPPAAPAAASGLDVDTAVAQLALLRSLRSATRTLDGLAAVVADDCADPCVVDLDNIEARALAALVPQVADFDRIAVAQAADPVWAGLLTRLAAHRRAAS